MTRAWVGEREKVQFDRECLGGSDIGLSKKKESREKMRIGVF